MIRVVSGHICSGKSTFVRDHARGEDVVIDMDRIATALAVEGTEHHAYGDHVRSIARATRWAAIDEAVQAHARGSFDVWIIHAYPSPQDIARYRRLGASIKQMECDHDTLLARAKSERPRSLQTELARRLDREPEKHAFSS